MIVDQNLPQKIIIGSENKLPQVIDGSITELTAIDLEGATSIKSFAFQNCSELTSITIPEGVTSIGTQAFNSCSSLTSINIPEGMTSIGNSAFYGCIGLTFITIPKGVTSIKGSAFNGCSSLTSITIKATTPPTLANTNAISSATTTIYIPTGTLSAYQSATNWSSFASKFVEKDM